jgi:signal transduction histidine kinase
VSRVLPARHYQGGYLVGFLIVGVAAVRAILFYQCSMRLVAVLLLVAYGILYAAEPVVSARLRWFGFLYLPLQAALVATLGNLRPFLDFCNVLYLPLSVQALRAFTLRAALGWTAVFSALLVPTLVVGMGWSAGLSLYLTILAATGFLLSYDQLYCRTQASQAQSQALLADLEQSHHGLRVYAAQAEELAVARERNRLAREMHDSVSQVILSIRFTAHAARLLLDRDPARVPEQLDRLQEMTGSALLQLRSLIAQLHPSHNP